MNVMDIPSGLDHLQMLVMLSETTRLASEAELKRHDQTLRVIGTSLSALYQASTCHRRCYGGPHILEALTGRAYNLGCAAYILASRGFYDESLNLTRSIGEISNLISLSVVDKDALGRWLSADHASRLRDFAPGKVRNLLKSRAEPMMYADKDWYTRLCEKYTHVNPGTKPNLHNDDGLPHVGGILQPAGLANSMGELATILGFVAMPVCKYFRLDDLFEELCRTLRSNPNDGEPNG